MNNNRFYVASEKLNQIETELIEQGFEELDECVSPDELADRIFIDTDKKTFYFTDEECVKEANEIIVEKYQQTYHSTDLKKIKQWPTA
ncbi:MAG: hypothetical protein H7Y10_04605 [Flavobacterium sp.]|nr:hypothetical protein [Flavobacterium sp.]